MTDSRPWSYSRRCDATPGTWEKTAFLRNPKVQLLEKEEYMSTEDKVKKMIAEKLNVDPSEVVPEAKFVDDLGADSLDLVELIMTMEEEFAIDYINAH